MTEVSAISPLQFRLALIQMRVRGGNKLWNLRHATDLIHEASLHGADVVLLPECVDLGWTHPSCRELAEVIPDGIPCRMLSKAAKEHGVYVCAGLTERVKDNVYNAAVLINRKGQVLCKHRKLNELAIGHEFYGQGDRLNVVQTEFGTFGVMICSDAFAPGQAISRSLCYMGADVILSPCAWAVPAGHDNVRQPYGDLWRSVYGPVCGDFSVWIAGVSNVGEIEAGPWAGQKCIGCSLVFGPDGKEVLMGPYGTDAETILYLNIVPVERPARGCGWDERR